MQLNHMICPNCGHDFYTECSYATCAACGTYFYACQSRTCERHLFPLPVVPLSPYEFDTTQPPIVFEPSEFNSSGFVHRGAYHTTFEGQNFTSMLGYGETFKTR